MNKEKAVAINSGFKEKLSSFALENINVIFLVILVIVGAMVSDKFFTEKNIANIFGRITITSFAAFGFTFVFLAGGFDLSIGSVVSVCAVLCVGLINKGTPWPVAIVLVLLAGMAFGVFNGIILSFIRADLSATFLITLGTQLLGASIALTYSGGFQLYLDSTLGEAFLDFFRMEIGSVSFIVIAMILFAVLFQVVLTKTRLGRNIYLVGGNKVAAFLAGIKISRVKLFTFVMSSLCAAVAAIFIVVRTTGASPKSGFGYEMDASIATMIGGNVMGGGKGGIARTFVGVLIMAIITNIMNLTGVETAVQRIVLGAILLCAILMDGLKKRGLGLGIRKRGGDTK